MLSSRRDFVKQSASKIKQNTHFTSLPIINSKVDAGSVSTFCILMEKTHPKYFRIVLSSQTGLSSMYSKRTRKYPGRRSIPDKSDDKSSISKGMSTTKLSKNE